MLTPDIKALMVTAAMIGFIHTLLGPDHYVPFVAMSKSRNWSRMRTAIVTVVCGIGHVASSILLGLVGVALGVAVAQLEFVEAVRGELAAWALIVFGLVYMVWGIRRAARHAAHRHGIHNHSSTGSKPGITPWILFTVFVLGPCEPLIPILMYPAAQNSTFGMLIVTSVFGLVTISTMLIMVLALSFGLGTVSLHRMERFTHALAGGAVLLCGVAIKLGL